MPSPAAKSKPRKDLRAPASPWEARRRPRHEHALKRDAVILAAARAFRERGYHNTSLDDLAASLKVTKPTLYIYVPGKEAMLFECFRAGLAQIEVAPQPAPIRCARGYHTGQRALEGGSRMVFVDASGAEPCGRESPRPIRCRHRTRCRANA